MSFLTKSYDHKILPNIGIQGFWLPLAQKYLLYHTVAIDGDQGKQITSNKNVLLFITRNLVIIVIGILRDLLSPRSLLERRRILKTVQFSIFASVEIEYLQELI